MRTSTVPLSEVAEFVRGVTFRPTDVVSEGVPVMTTKAVQKSLITSGASRIPAVLVKRKEQYLQEGDTLVSTANSRNLVGKCCWVPRLHEPSAVGGFVTALRPNETVEPRYLYHWFSSVRVQETVRNLANQTTNIANLSIARCRDLPIPLPSIREQRRIVDILDCADSLRASRIQAVDLLGELMASTFSDMFCGANGEFLPDIPLVAVRAAGRVQLGRQRAPKYQTGLASRPYVRVANVHEDRLALTDILTMDFDAKDFEAYRLHYGDILLNEGQSTELVGRPAMWRDEIPGCCFQNTLVRFQAGPQVRPQFALAVFLHYYRMRRFAKISSKTSNVAHLGAARFASMPFPLPALASQDAYCARAAASERVGPGMAEHLKLLNGLFLALQQHAFAEV